MKHLLFHSIIALLLMSSSLYGYEVSTEIQKKRVLLEEFTGIHCGFCPQGHAIGNRLIAAQPENVYVIAIHAGSFAIPGSDEPDFRTEAGDIINTEFKVTGNPSGTVNRHAFSDGTNIITGRSDWAQNCKDIHNEDASVNLWISSEFEDSNRQLTVNIEGYYTADSEETENYLNVAWTQSNIQGPQSGGGVGNEYIHKHMLRGYITQDWGDVIQNTQKGQYFNRTYTYTLPKSINGVEVKAEDIEIIAFVCESKTEVLNVIGTKPRYLNYEKPIGVTLKSPNMSIGTDYGFNFFEMILTNNSDKTIEEVDFKVTINEKEQQVKWSGSLPGFIEMPIHIDVEPYEIKETNQYQIKVTAINGESYENKNAILSGRFKAPTEITSLINLTIKTDLYAEENSFTIKDQNGNTFKEFGPYPSNTQKEYQEEIKLDENKIYCLEVTDSWADGIQQPRGNYKLYDDGNNLIIENKNIESFGYRSFFRTSLPSGITSQLDKPISVQINQKEKNITIQFTTNAPQIIEIYSITGKLVTCKSTETDLMNLSVSTLPMGLYLLRIIENQEEAIYKFILE